MIQKNNTYRNSASPEPAGTRDEIIFKVPFAAEYRQSAECWLLLLRGAAALLLAAGCQWAVRIEASSTVTPPRAREMQVQDTAAERKTRAARFSKKTLEVPVPRVRTAFTDAGPNGKWVSNSTEALAKLIARKIERGEQLSEAQLAAANAAGIDTRRRGALTPASANSAGRQVGEFVLACNESNTHPGKGVRGPLRQPAAAKAKKKKKEKKKTVQAWQQAERTLQPEPAATPTVAFAPPSTSLLASAAAPAAESGGKQKKLKKLRKLMRQIKQLEQSQAAGQILMPAQIDKLGRMQSVRAEIAELEGED